MCSQRTSAKLGTTTMFVRGDCDCCGSRQGVAKCVNGTPWVGPDVEARVDPLAWDGVRQGRGLESSGP
jgi:hypothetical protein